MENFAEGAGDERAKEARYDVVRGGGGSIFISGRVMCGGRWVCCEQDQGLGLYLGYLT